MSAPTTINDQQVLCSNEQAENCFSHYGKLIGREIEALDVYGVLCTISAVVSAIFAPAAFLTGSAAMFTFCVYRMRMGAYENKTICFSAEITKLLQITTLQILLSKADAALIAARTSSAATAAISQNVLPMSTLRYGLLRGASITSSCLGLLNGVFFGFYVANFAGRIFDIKPKSAII
ncbi:MAG: hypothetical protein WC222_05315 [Parachlamydiales bacterium]|jgi:hypothetical protein